MYEDEINAIKKSSLKNPDNIIQNIKLPQKLHFPDDIINNVEDSPKMNLNEEEIPPNSKEGSKVFSRRETKKLTVKNKGFKKMKTLKKPSEIKGFQLKAIDMKKNIDEEQHYSDEEVDEDGDDLEAHSNSYSNSASQSDADSKKNDEVSQMEHDLEIKESEEVKQENNDLTKKNIKKTLNNEVYEINFILNGNPVSNE